MSDICPNCNNSRKGPRNAFGKQGPCLTCQPSASEGERVEHEMGKLKVYRLSYSYVDLSELNSCLLDDRFPEGATVEIICRLVKP